MIAYLRRWLARRSCPQSWVDCLRLLPVLGQVQVTVEVSPLITRAVTYCFPDGSWLVVLPPPDRREPDEVLHEAVHVTVRLARVGGGVEEQIVRDLARAVRWGWRP